MLARALQSLDLDALTKERDACLSALLAVARGEKVVRAGFDARSVEYGPADQGRLEELIAALDAAIAAKQAGVQMRRRPILARFG